MRVSQTQALAAGSQARSARRKGGGEAFRLNRRAAARKTGAAQAPAVVSTLDAIVALQGIDDRGERRREAVRRGHQALDILDDLKVALLSGQVPAAKLRRLNALLEHFNPDDAEPELADLLRQIDLRARVELAKRGKPAA